MNRYGMYLTNGRDLIHSTQQLDKENLSEIVKTEKIRLMTCLSMEITLI